MESVTWEITAEGKAGAEDADSDRRPLGEEACQDVHRCT